MKSVFFPKFMFLFMCVKLCFYLKWCAKRKKSQLKKIVCETMNFGSKNFTKPTKNL